jgi:hypothetical protein
VRVERIILIMKKSIKIALVTVAVLGLAGICVGLYLFNLQAQNLQKAKPDFAITSIDLQKAFEDNEAVSIAKYVNKIIEVTGTIESVKAGEGNITNVALKTGSELSLVICTMSPQSDPAPLVSGNEVTIRGECSGFLMDVLMNNCVVIK